MKRPALNWGIQFKTVDSMANKNGKVQKSTLEVIWPDTVYNGSGEVPDKPLHAVVPELIGNTKCKIQNFEPTGLRGLLEMCLPPYTSEDPEIRNQQIVIICAFLAVSNSPFVRRYLGGCPSITLGSWEPGTLKTSTAKLGQLISGGDPGSFLETNSTAQAVEASQSQVSWVTTHDDAERQKGTHQNILGSYGGGIKSTVTKGSSEKVGGLCKTLNYTENMKIESKVIEGRDLLFDMLNKAKDSMKDRNVVDIYDMGMKHLEAMNKRSLPRDYIAEFTGNHFMHDGYDNEETNFQRCHRKAVDLIGQKKPSYQPRRLSSCALPFTSYLLLECDIEKKNDDLLRELFVDVFGDHSSFFDECINEIEKAEVIINQLNKNHCDEKKVDTDEENDESQTDVPENEEEKVKALFESCLKDKSKLVLTRYMKIFDMGTYQV